MLDLDKRGDGGGRKVERTEENMKRAAFASGKQQSSKAAAKQETHAPSHNAAQVSTVQSVSILESSKPGSGDFHLLNT